MIKGDELREYYEKVFRKYFSSLCVFSFQIVRNQCVAEDIVQDVFFEVWNKKESIDFDKPIKSLLYTYTKNRSLDYLKKSSTQFEQHTENLVETPLLDNIIMNLYEQENNYQVKILKGEISTIVETLPEQCKRIYKLSRENGLNNKEIAGLLSITHKAVERQITKALSTLRKKLIQGGFLS